MNLEQAIEVARADYNVGIQNAIETLEEMGYDCSYYWDTIANVDDVDEDDLNTITRDKQYEILGIDKVMEQAYEIVEEEDY